jgi:lysophospholipase L1-like esterase
MIWTALLSLICVGSESLSSKALGQDSPPRAVFIGDSITSFWAWFDGKFFTNNNYVNKGVGGQTSADVLQRFQRDVIALGPAAVMIQAGTNDIAEKQGPVSDEQIIENLGQMAALARAKNIKVIIGSIPPAGKYFWNPSIQPASRIAELNPKIKAWATSHGYGYADFWSAMALSDGAMNPRYTKDGTHPIANGYAVMEPIAKDAIEEALKSDP